MWQALVAQTALETRQCVAVLHCWPHGAGFQHLRGRQSLTLYTTPCAPAPSLAGLPSLSTTNLICGEAGGSRRHHNEAPHAALPKETVADFSNQAATRTVPDSSVRLDCAWSAPHASLPRPPLPAAQHSRLASPNAHVHLPGTHPPATLCPGPEPAALLRCASRWR